MSFKKYYDALGEVCVEKTSLWRATTQRSLENFPIHKEKMPWEVIQALAQIKKAYALAHQKNALLSDKKAQAIVFVAEEILEGKGQEHFPLSVFQTGSGTQSNMNVNEVIAERALEKFQETLHPNDDVNKSQSSNDVFPSALHMAIYEKNETLLLPSLQALIASFLILAKKAEKRVKIGRTHLQDAVPMYVHSELEAFAFALQRSYDKISMAAKQLLPLALGGTAVGTGLHASKEVLKEVFVQLQKNTGFPYVQSPNLFHALSMKDEVLSYHGEIKVLASNLFKIASDLRLLASGPACGLGEITLPANEPGSSIMPGKVNPTQVEALCMVVAEVLGNDTTLSFAAGQGHLQLNTYMPLIAQKTLQSVEHLALSMQSFRSLCVEGIAFVDEKNQENLEKSLMLVTALTKHIGYDKASQCVKFAQKENKCLWQAVAELCEVTEETAKNWLSVESMLS